jgi:cytochrome c biogenesis protein CcmG/thiol:disulfide interchange protein DsbE
MHGMDDAATATIDTPPDGDERAPDSDPAPEPPAPRGSRWATAAWIVSSLLLVALVFGFWLRVSSDRAGAELNASIIAGKRPAAPALPTSPVTKDSGLPDWYSASGDTQTAGPDNEVLVVNWWASWCRPCADEAPILEDIAQDYEGRVTIVGLNAGFEDLHSEAREFAKRYDVTFPLVRGSRVDRDTWGVKGYPETFIIGTDGKISSFINGPVDDRDLRGLLDRELDEDRT